MRATLIKKLKLLPITLLAQVEPTKSVSFNSNNKAPLCKTGITVLSN